LAYRFIHFGFGAFEKGGKERPGTAGIIEKTTVFSPRPLPPATYLTSLFRSKPRFFQIFLKRIAFEKSSW